MTRSEQCVIASQADGVAVGDDGCGYDGGSTIQVQDLWVPPTVREHDVVLMDAFIQDQALAEHEITKINSV